MNPSSNWPHAPPHVLLEKGVYMVTCGTYLKLHHFRSEERLQLLYDTLMTLAKEFRWELHAWAVFSNHYHFVGRSPTDPSSLSRFIGELHRYSAVRINSMDNTAERKVWCQFWDRRIDKHPSYLARLNYVHRNAEKHGLVQTASSYRWCSASEFEQAAGRSFVRSVYRFDYNKVSEYDDF